MRRAEQAQRKHRYGGRPRGLRSLAGCACSGCRPPASKSHLALAETTSGPASLSRGRATARRGPPTRHHIRGTGLFAPRAVETGRHPAPPGRGSSLPPPLRRRRPRRRALVLLLLLLALLLLLRLLLPEDAGAHAHRVVELGHRHSRDDDARPAARAGGAARSCGGSCRELRGRRGTRSTRPASRARSPPRAPRPVCRGRPHLSWCATSVMRMKWPRALDPTSKNTRRP